MPTPANLVHESSVSTSTGNFTLASKFGKRTFNDAYGTGGTDVFWYFIASQDANEWEVGTGHLSTSTTLVRDTVIESSNADALVNFASGTKDVSSDVPADEQITVTELSGAVIGSAYGEYTTSTALSTVMVFDDTIPQNTEGTQIISAAITPSATSSKIRASFQAWGTMDGFGTIVAALFQDSVANALAATAVFVVAADNRTNILLEFEHSPATTSAVTYKLRIGPNAGNLYLNGLSTGRRLGGVSRATLALEEIKA